MNPARLQRLLQDGLAHHQAGRLADAETLYRQARAGAPKSFDALHLSGVLAFQQSRFADAADILARALRIEPKSAICEMRLALSLAALNRHSEAELHYRASLKRDDQTPETWNNLALTLRALGKVEEAIASYRRAVELRPGYHDAHDRLGAILADTQGLSAGIPHFRRSVELKADYAPGWCNLGLALIFERKFTEALSCLERALSLDPNLVQAMVGCGLVYQQTYRLPEAIAAYEKAIARQPDHFEAGSARLLCLNYLSGLDRQSVFQQHLAFAQAVGPVTPLANPAPSAGPRRKLAFLSPDLRNHSVAYFLLPLLGPLREAGFDVLLYHDHFQVDAMSERLRQKAAVWRNFVGQPGTLVEQAIRRDAPDVLVDLAGHTGYNRLPLLARRLAPVQINFLGYPNTTGLPTMDFRLVDAITDPNEEDQRFHTEKLVRFAPCAWAYQPPESSPDPALPPDGPVTFGSFNNFAKVSEKTLQLWRQVLEAVPQSRLLLKAHSLTDPELGPLVQAKLRTLGVEQERIILLGRTPNIQSHLDLYQKVDVALDTFPYHGTTTTCEALWMGVPVVTLRGDRHAARVSASLLSAAGHPEWIASSESEYVSIATGLAADRISRTLLRTRIRQDLQRSPVMDYAAYARHFIEALQTCIREKSGTL